MYTIIKEFDISAAHKLNLNYPSNCSTLHGHNWRIKVFCRSKELNENGMVIDFTQIKELVQNKFNHAYLNDILDFNPTAENIAKWIVDTVPFCYKAVVEETDGSIAIYEKDVQD